MDVGLGAHSAEDQMAPTSECRLGPPGTSGSLATASSRPRLWHLPCPLSPSGPLGRRLPRAPKEVLGPGVGMSSPAGALAATPPHPTPCCCVRPQRWGLSQPPSPLQGSHHEQAPFLGGQRVSSAAWCADSGSSGVVGCLLFSLCPRWEGLPLQRPLCVGDRPRDCFPSPGAVPVARRDPDPSSC